MSIHDLVECDMKELDVNYNDPAFDGSNIYPDAFHQHIKSDKSLNSPMKIHGHLPADLTNLQWLQHMNVAIPVEHSAVNQLHDATVMVDPNTAMPVQANGWTRAAPPSAIHTTSIQQQISQRRPMDKPKKLNNVPISAKEDKSTKDKAYPKPVFSYSCLIAMALQDSDAGTLPVSEIYKFMQYGSLLVFQFIFFPKNIVFNSYWETHFCYLVLLLDQTSLISRQHQMAGRYGL